MSYTIFKYTVLFITILLFLSQNFSTIVSELDDLYNYIKGYEKLIRTNLFILMLFTGAFLSSPLSYELAKGGYRKVTNYAKFKTEQRRFVAGFKADPVKTIIESESTDIRRYLKIKRKHIGALKLTMKSHTAKLEKLYICLTITTLTTLTLLLLCLSNLRN